MKLFGSLTSPYVRKVRTVVAEKNIACEFVRDAPREPGSQAQARNPLGKIPVLETDDGENLYDSPVIAMYLDTLPGPTLVPAGAARWKVLRTESVADGLCDATVAWMNENKRPDKNADFLAWEARRIERGVKALGASLGADFGLGEFSLADIAVVCALDYVDFRFGHDWHRAEPRLAAWRDATVKRPSLQSTVIVPPPP